MAVLNTQTIQNAMLDCETIADVVTTTGDAGGFVYNRLGQPIKTLQKVIEELGAGGIDGLHLNGLDIASSASIDLGAATGDYVNITGTSTISSFGTADAGVERILVFSAALTLTYNATSLILLGSASFTTAAGDVLHFRSLGSGNWRHIGGGRRSGKTWVPTPAADISDASANGRSLITAANYAAMRTLLSLVIGTNVQAFDAELTALAGLTFAANKFILLTGAGTCSTADVSANAQTFLAAANFAAMRTALGLGTSATLDVDTDGTMTANSATRVPAQSAVVAYVANSLAGLKWKPSVLVATTANITLSGEQTIDGVLTSASRVLVKNQSSGTENGIYVSAAGAWVRSTDADLGSELVNATVTVEQGTVGENKIYTCSNNSVTIGVTSITFVQAGGPSLYTADESTLTLSGNQFAAKDAGITYSKIQNISATDKVLGRSTAGAGSPEEIAFTPVARTLSAAATQTAQLGVLGLSGTLPNLAIWGNDVPKPLVSFVAMPNRRFLPGMNFTRTVAANYVNRYGYLASAPIDVMRMAYDPTTYEFLGLQIEQANDNKILQSQTFATTWSTKTSDTITSDSTVAPDNTTTGDTVVESSGTGEHGVSQTVTTTVSQRRGFGVWIKPSGRTYAALRLSDNGATSNNGIVIFNLSGNGSIVSTTNNGNAVGFAGKIVYYKKTGWYRCQICGVANTSGTTILCEVIPSTNGTTISYAGSSAASVVFWGAQLNEVHSAPNIPSGECWLPSYIATTTVAVTRTADVLSHDTALGSFYNSTAVSLYCNLKVMGSETDMAIFALSDGTQNNQLDIFINGAGIKGRGRSGAAEYWDDDNSNYSTTLANRYAVSFENGAQLCALNGVAGESGAVATHPTGLTNLDIGSRGGTTTSLNGWIKECHMWGVALTQAQCQIVTGVAA